MRVYRQIDLEKVGAQLAYAARQHCAPDAGHRNQFAQPARPRGFTAARRQQMTADRQHGHRQQQNAGHQQAGVTVPDQIDAESRGHRTCHIGHRAGQRKVAVVASPVLLVTQLADQRLQRDVAEGCGQPQADRRRHQRRHAGKVKRQQDAQRAARNTRQHQPARAETIGEFAAGPRKQYRHDAETGRQHAYQHWWRPQFHAIQRKQRARAVHAGHVEQQKEDQEADGH